MRYIIPTTVFFLSNSGFSVTALPIDSSFTGTQLLIGSLSITLILGLYNLLEYFRRSEAKESLYLSLSCFGGGFYLLASNSWFYQSEVFGYNLVYNQYLSSIGFLIGTYFFIRYLDSIFADIEFPWTKKLIDLSLVLVLGHIIFTNNAQNTYWISISLIFSLGSGRILIEAIYKKLESSMFIVSSISLLILTADLNFLQSNELISGPELKGISVALFFFLQSQVIAKKTAYAFTQVKNLSTHLQEEVEQQTRSLQLKREALEKSRYEIHQAHEKLQEADNLKTKFFRSVSHELRTPLSLILGTLKGAKKPTQLSQESLDVAHQNAQRLYRLVNQLLDFQKMSQTIEEFPLTPLDLREFTENVSRYFADACKEKEIQFTLNLPQEELFIKGHLAALEKILFNYAINALNYTLTRF